MVGKWEHLIGLVVFLQDHPNEDQEAGGGWGWGRLPLQESRLEEFICNSTECRGDRHSAKRPWVSSNRSALGRRRRRKRRRAEEPEDCGGAQM